MKYNKLVRDRVPEIIRKKGGNPIIYIADKKEYWRKLKEKLIEEIKEFNKDERIEEMADILETINAVIDYKRFNRRKLELIKNKKAKERGGFKKRIILEES